MSQMRKNLKVVAIALLILGLIFLVLAALDFIALIAEGAYEPVPITTCVLGVAQCVVGLWAGWAAVQGGNVPSKAKAALAACVVACLCYLASAAFDWWANDGLDALGLALPIVAAVAALAGIVFARAVHNESLDQLS